MSFAAFAFLRHAPAGGTSADADKKHGVAQYGRRARTSVMAALLVSTVIPAFAADAGNRGMSAADLRTYIAKQVGGLDKLRVPATNDALPVPRLPDGTVPYRYETTEAKRFLGKMLFHDPVRTVRIDKNYNQPVDLPVGTAFGGTIDATNPNIQAIISATRQTGSCGSCHIGEAAGKAGQVLNFNVGGEGRGYYDEAGNFFPRRRPQSILTQQRVAPIFPGDALVDVLPTLTDVDLIKDHGQAEIEVTNPSKFYHVPNPAFLLETGRLDELDSVGRQSPSMVGAGFNNRLLLGGFAGEPMSAPGSLNPYNDPAQENLTLLLLDAHRMFKFESAVLQNIPAFVKLFQEAFPREAQQANTTHNLNYLITDETVFRATATFLRTVVTRNTPFDRFLAGDNGALTPNQVQGAFLFFTPAVGGAGGAGCFTCHSGPMLNKQTNDRDVTGMGKFVDQNFFNVGIGDHPVQALNALARGHLNPAKLGSDGYPYHAEDNGRQDVTGNTADAFSFRSLTLRQLKGARTFFHNGSFTSVRDAVAYFNAGVPQDPTAAASSSLSDRFTQPRGPGYPGGLGLTEAQIDAIADFLENGLYDPAFVNYDPASSTDTFQPNAHDLTYSVYHPELSLLGAKDGYMVSGLAIDDNDSLARRDEGLEFLNVTQQCQIAAQSSAGSYQITNTGTSVIDTNLLVIVNGLPPGVKLLNASGTTNQGEPYLRLFLQNGVLNPNASVNIQLQFSPYAGTLNYTLALLSGQGRQVVYQ